MINIAYARELFEEKRVEKQTVKDVKNRLMTAGRGAVKFPDFYSWGGGGDIRKVEIERLV